MGGKMGQIENALGISGGQRKQSPQEAAKALRARISGGVAEGIVRGAGNAAWLAWLAAKTVGIGILLFFLELLFLLLDFNQPYAFVAAFIIGDVALIAMAYLEIRKRFGPILKGRSEKGIVIGKSFRHVTEMGGHSLVEVGYDGVRRIDYLREPNPHVLIVGSTSSGKTTTMRSFVTRVALQDRVPFLVIDWNGENEEWAKATNTPLWKVPGNFKVNPFRLNGMTKEGRASVASESLALSARLTALQATKVKSALLRFYLDGREPSLFELWESLCYRNASKANVLDQRLRSVQRVIGSEPDAFWDGVFSRNSVVSLQGLNESEKSLVAHAILQRLTELFDRERWDSARPRLVVVADEAWQMLRRSGEFDPRGEHVAERIVRLGRKYGIGMVISTQQLDDVPKAFIASSALRMLHQHVDASYLGRDVLGLNAYEEEYLRDAAQGEMLLFDRGRSQKGAWHSEYVKVTPATAAEVKALAGLYEPFEPGKINESEMPIEEQDGRVEAKASEARKPPATAKAAQAGKLAPSKKVRVPEGAPGPALYAALLAIRDNPGADLGALVAYVKAKGWFTSPTTLYGSKGNPGIVKGVVAAGLAIEREGKYVMTPLGAKWADPETMMETQSERLGSEEHRQLMARTIRHLQDKLILPVVSNEKHSFDILAIPVNSKKRGLWDPSAAKGCEVQTTARKDSIAENAGKRELWRVGIVWVASGEGMAEELRKATGGGDEYLVLPP